MDASKTIFDNLFLSLMEEGSLESNTTAKEDNVESGLHDYISYSSTNWLCMSTVVSVVIMHHPMWSCHSTQ